MPGFDGTGPRGQGPMTGKANGFCLMNIPDDPGEAKTGLAGRDGKPMSFPGDHRAPEIFFLHARLRELQDEIHEIKSRLANLETGGDNR